MDICADRWTDWKKKKKKKKTNCQTDKMADERTDRLFYRTLLASALSQYFTSIVNLFETIPI